MADRVGVINKGELILVQEKAELMRRLGRKQLTLQLLEPIDRIPESLGSYGLECAEEGKALVYTYDTQAERTGIASLMRRLSELGIAYKDLSTHQSSLEDIFVELVHGDEARL
jgi:ABC-2 type transport system ATP-binding protein